MRIQTEAGKSSTGRMNGDISVMRMTKRERVCAVVLEENLVSRRQVVLITVGVM